MGKKVYDTESIYLQVGKQEEQEREYTYSKLAQRKIELIEEQRPDKSKAFNDNELTEEQKELIDYLKKVIETNEL